MKKILEKQRETWRPEGLKCTETEVEELRKAVYEAIGPLWRSPRTKHLNIPTVAASLFMTPVGLYT